MDGASSGPVGLLFGHKGQKRSSQERERLVEWMRGETEYGDFTQLNRIIDSFNLNVD